MSGAREGENTVIDDVLDTLRREGESSGYFLNPDETFTRELIHGLLVNEERYGYRACPCRLASGNRADDLDIICPCDYRDLDLEEHGSCYCALYVSQRVRRGEVAARPVPERRPPEVRGRSDERTEQTANGRSPSLPVWRCRVCGYLCGREEPPGICPICKAGKERFERFM